MPENNYNIKEYLSDYVKNYPDKEIRILNSAINSFSERGFNGTTTKEIAQGAGIAEGTIFRYFPSKEAILQKMVPLLIRVMQPRIEKPIQQILEDTEDLSVNVVISKIIFDRIRMARDNAVFLKSVLPELIHRESLLEQLKISIILTMEKYLDIVFKTAKKRGEIRDDINGRIVMYQVLGFVFSYSLLGATGDDATIKREIDTFLDYQMKGWQRLTRVDAEGIS